MANTLGFAASIGVKDDVLCVDRGVVIVGEKLYRKIKADGEFWFKLVSSNEGKKKITKEEWAEKVSAEEVSGELKSEMDPVLKEWGRRFLAELEDWGQANQAGIKSLEKDKERLKDVPNLGHATTKEMLDEVASRLAHEGILNAKGRGID